MSKINICLISDEAVSTIKANLNKFSKLASENPNDNTRFCQELPDGYLVEKKYVIDDFSLKTSISGNYADVDFENAVLLYQRLNSLPRHILGDERFWLWIILEKGYSAALQSMPIERGKNIIRDHWLFGQGLRRGLFFGVLSRAYYRVALTIDPNNEKDEYHLTKFSTENYERFRHLTWRSYSNNSVIVRGALKGEIEVLNQFGKRVDVTNYYTQIGKYVSQLGSVMLVDVMTEEEVKDKVVEYFKKLVEESSSES